MALILNSLALTFIGSLLLLDFAFGQFTGNGAGGIKKTGHIMTFKTAGIKISAPDELTVQRGKKDVPGLQKLMNLWSNEIQFISLYDRSKILTSLANFGNRRYYDIDRDWLTSKKRSELISIYRQETDQKEDDLTIFALTDPETMTTFLIPEFYDLNEVEQQSILMHEAEWIRRPKISYKQILFLESSFQSYLEDTNDFERQMNLALALDFKDDLVAFALQKDQQDGRISKKGDILTDGSQSIKLSFGQILGSDYFKCAESSRSEYRGSSEYRAHIKRSCYQFIWQNARRLKETFPQSYFINLVYWATYNQQLTWRLVGFDPWQISLEILEKLLDAPLKIRNLRGIRSVVTDRSSVATSFLDRFNRFNDSDYYFMDIKLTPLSSINSDITVRHSDVTD